MFEVPRSLVMTPTTPRAGPRSDHLLVTVATAPLTKVCSELIISPRDAD